MVKISLHTPFVGVVGNVPSNFFFFKMYFGAFGVYFNIILS